jgi:hypothetical protein
VPGPLCQVLLCHVDYFCIFFFHPMPPFKNYFSKKKISKKKKLERETKKKKKKIVGVAQKDVAQRTWHKDKMIAIE